jgi:hypothetical protein
MDALSLLVSRPTETLSRPTETSDATFCRISLKVKFDKLIHSVIWRSEDLRYMFPCDPKGSHYEIP